MWGGGLQMRGPLSQKYCPQFVVWVYQPTATLYSSLGIWLESQTSLNFTTSLGIAGCNNRDFAFIFYAWLGYCCFSLPPWFPFQGLALTSPTTGGQSDPKPGMTIDVDQGEAIRRYSALKRSDLSRRENHQVGAQWRRSESWNALSLSREKKGRSQTVSQDCRDLTANRLIVFTDYF